MAGKLLPANPTIDPSAKLHDTKLGAYCEVGARTILHEVAMDDYSYVVNDAEITYATIGKFCSIAAMTSGSGTARSSCRGARSAPAP